LRIDSWKIVALIGLAAGIAVFLLSDLPDEPERDVEALIGPSDSACRACHASATPFIVEDYLSGPMGIAGVNCTSCHLANPADGDAVSHNGFDITVTPSPNDCAVCHPDQVSEFNSSKHFIGWTKMEGVSRYVALPEEVRSPMCEGCHNIGKVHADGSQGKCDSCHTRHSFSAEEARKPESCGTCHMGPDHPQIEAYLTSKHGVMYSLESDTWNWSDPTTFTAPVCMTCHMPGGTHNVDEGITIGGTSSGSTITGTPQPFPMANITSAAFEENRTAMLAVCTQCHSESFARERLSAADSVKNETNALVGEARDILIQLYNEGLLDPMPAERAANPITGYNLTLMGQQLYSNTSGIETLFFKMYKYHDVTAWKGGYHFSPDYTHWYGWAEVNHDLEMIKAEDRELRAQENSGILPGNPDDDMDLLPGAIVAAAAIVMIGAVIITRQRKPGSPKT